MQKNTELMINNDGTIFHLKLQPGDIADKILLVGDPERVEMISSLLHDIRVKKHNREFHTVTGSYDLGEISIISTGIGTDNIDIVINELDALANLDLQSGTAKEDPVSLTLLRIGTCGAIRSDIPAGSTVLTETAVGFDGLLHFYEGYDWMLDTVLSDAIVYHLEWPDTLAYPYAVNADKELMELFRTENFFRGITISAPGFYAPQGRKLRLESFDNEINHKLAEFNYRGKAICNYEMESSALYGLARLMGHKALTLCTVVGNRVTGEFLRDYKPEILRLAEKVLKVL
jgi:uridine phosphorylase